MTLFIIYVNPTNRNAGANNMGCNHQIADFFNKNRRFFMPFYLQNE